MLQINLFHSLIFFPPGGVNDAEENQIGGAGVFDVLHGVGGDVDGLVGANKPGFAADVHNALALEDVVNFGCFEAVAVRGEAGFYDGVRQAVTQVEVSFVGVQQFAQDGVIAGNERFAVLQVFDKHSRVNFANEVFRQIYPKSSFCPAQFGLLSKWIILANPVAWHFNARPQKIARAFEII